MTHARQQIRNAIVALIITDGVVGTRCYPSRIRPHTDLSEVRANVFTNSEAVRLADISGTQERNLEVIVELITRADADFDDDLDAAAVRVEKALYNNQSTVADTVTLTGSRLFAGSESEGTKHLAGLQLTFSVLYTTHASDPETIL